MLLQTVVDYCKKIMNVFIGMHGSMNDVQILCISNLYQNAINGNLFQLNHGKKVSNHYIGIKGYPLMPWLMILHKQITNAWHMILGALYNARAKTLLGGTIKNITP